MATVNQDVCIARALGYEGSTYTDGVHPYDPGGPTKYGITIPDIPGATASTIKNLTKDEAIQIYGAKYWDKMRCNELPSGVDESVLDYGINSGIGRSGKVLRQCVGLPTNTSAITDDVLAAVAKRDAKAIIIAINDERIRFLQSLKIWPTYKNGWTSRVNDCKQFSLSLAAGAPQPTGPGTVPGKAKIPPPKSVKKTTKTVATGGTVAAGAGFKDWIAAHPAEAVIILAVIVAAVAGIIYLINKNHQRRQETPIPVAPVPAVR